MPLDYQENYNKNWQLGEQKPLQLNVVNAYEFKGDQILNYKRITNIFYNFLHHCSILKRWRRVLAL